MRGENKKKEIIFDPLTVPFFLNFSAASELHHEFPMIKYARGGRSIPHERVFKLDNDNLVRADKPSIDVVIVNPQQASEATPV